VSNKSFINGNNQQNSVSRHWRTYEQNSNCSVVLLTGGAALNQSLTL